ncbi:class I SAM-dependent methyltransferase [Nitrosomonas sp. Is37]|uniref:class I SAM-dependent methyltransferase n=1 Tax=Nitrosomonas sp. Is37 TaxID=3080535 RepID=UPI00294B7E1B|nr:class I SAM-dependent methyltransferase [Nitrosomonas sp. Is37]MDV6343026.1 class I SAM-dependent methyltransferase [Nitrosomonas sp. Is37]
MDRPAGHRIARRQPNDRVLEIGFGPGVGIELLADSVSLGKVAGIDPSEEMLEQTKDRNATGIATGRVELLRGSVERLPFEKAMFDKALAINSMQVWPDALAGLQETRRVLKPGGTVLLGFTRYSGQQKEGLTEILMAAGFADVRMVDVDGGFCVFGTNLVGTEEAAI